MDAQMNVIIKALPNEARGFLGLMPETDQVSFIEAIMAGDVNAAKATAHPNFQGMGNQLTLLCQATQETIQKVL